MDSDDYIEPDYLEKMLEPYQANSSLDLVICNYFNDNTPKENSFITQSKYGIRDRIETMREFANPKSFKGFAWNKLYKLDLIEQNNLRYDMNCILVEDSRKTKLGRVEWNPGTLAGVLANERHCGDVLARKTFTPNFLTHKSKKNNNDRTQYRQKNHHEAIVSREVFNAANHLRASRNYSKKNRPLPVLSVVEDGILRGYVPFDIPKLR